MFVVRLMVSLFELALMAVMSGIIIFVIYRVFIRANPDFDMEAEISNGNIAVGTLVAVIMLCAALILQKGLGATVGMFRLAASAPPDAALPLWQSGLLALGHLLLSLGIAVFTISVALRLFGRLARSLNPEMRLGDQLKRGNVAVGIVLSAVVFIATFYVAEGVSALTKALVPQPEIGRIQIMR